MRVARFALAMVETYYEVIGVSPDASESEIRTAYREALKETHPDVNDADDAGRRTQLLLRAKDVLTDDEERARYDRLGHDDYLAEASNPFDPTTVDDATRPEGGDDARETAWGDEPADVEGANWEDTRGADEGVANGGGSYARAGGDDWRAWDSDRSYAVGEGDGGWLAGAEIPSSGTIVTVLAILFIYPALLWGTFLPAIPLPMNFMMGLLALVIVAYLQSLPTAAVGVFGFWTLVLPPTVVLGFGVPLGSVLGVGVLLGVLLPLCFSLLTRTMVRY